MPTRSLHAPRPARRHFVATALAASVLATGCGSITQLYLDDKSASSASARVLHRWGSEPGGGGLELELSSVRGQGSQRLGEFAFATLGEQSITGPAQLAHTARVQHAQLAYNHLIFAGRPFELEWFVGAASVRTTWQSVSARPGDPTLSRTLTWRGPAGGALGRMRLGPLLALEARVSGATDLRGRSDRGTREAAELALALRPLPSLVLRGGLAESRVNTRPPDGYTELSLRLRGPFLNVGLEF